MTGETVMALIRWACGALLMAVPAAVVFYLLGARVGRATGERERSRLAQRLETFTTILAPVAEAIREGRPGFRMSPRNKATLALLVQEPGEDGDKIADLERMFHEPPTG
jgi:hypothetical protein